MSIIKNTLRSVLFILLALNISTAQASMDQARSFVNALSSNTLTIIKNKQQSNAEKEKNLTALFKKTIDTEWIGKFALGRYIRTMTQEQKSRYNTLYTEFLILNYVPNFRDYTGQTLKITSISETGENTYLVQTNIIDPDGSTIRVDYRLRQKGDIFKIYDIIAEGVSLISTQRAEFGSILSQQGVDALLAKLDARVKAGATASSSTAKK